VRHSSTRQRIRTPQERSVILIAARSTDCQARRGYGPEVTLGLWASVLPASCEPGPVLEERGLTRPTSVGKKPCVRASDFEVHGRPTGRVREARCERRRPGGSLRKPLGRPKASG